MNAHQSLSHTNNNNALSLACNIVIDGEVTRLLPNKRSIDVHSITRDIMMIIYVRSTIVAGVSVFFCVQAEGKMLSIKKGPVSCKCSEMVTFVLLLLSTFFAQALSKLRKSLRDKKSMSNASPSPVGSSGSFFFGGGGGATGNNPADQVHTTL